MTLKSVKVGVVGCGNVSSQYFSMARNFRILEIAALTDLDMAKAQAKGKEYGIAKVCSFEQMLQDPEIEVILNLTIPKAHVAVTLEAIEAGKHVYSEKPLATSFVDAAKICDASKTKGVLIACAPDTVLGAGVQTARKMIDDESIGKPVAFTAFMLCPGHESWHPNPEFYYQPGGGPMFDMGPYYLTALLNLLGLVKQISGLATVAIPQRTNKSGQKITVQTPDHICGLMQFANGAAGTIITSFAARFPTHDPKQPITIYGTEGTLRVPDPNGFDGTVHLRRNDDADWREVPHAFVKGYGRGVGLADLAYGIRTGRNPRCGGEQALAATELMQGFLESSQAGKVFVPAQPYTRPNSMPADLPFGELDE